MAKGKKKPHFLKITLISIGVFFFGIILVIVIVLASVNELITQIQQMVIGMNDSIGLWVADNISKDDELLDRYWSSGWDWNNTINEYKGTSGDLGTLSAEDLYEMLSYLDRSHINEVSSGLYDADTFMYLLKETYCAYETKAISGIFYESSYEWTFTAEELYSVYHQAYETLKEYGYDEETGTWNVSSGVGRLGAGYYYVLDYVYSKCDQLLADGIANGEDPGEIIAGIFDDDDNFEGSVSNGKKQYTYDTYGNLQLASFADTYPSYIYSASDLADLITDDTNLPTILTWWNTYSRSLQYSPLSGYFVKNVLGYNQNSKAWSLLFGHDLENAPFTGMTLDDFKFYYSTNDSQRNSLSPGLSSEVFSLSESALLSPVSGSEITHFLSDNEGLSWTDAYLAQHPDDAFENSDDYDFVYTYNFTSPLSSVYQDYTSPYKANLSYDDYYSEYGITWQYIYAACILHDKFRGEVDENGYLVLDEDFLKQAIEVFIGDQHVTCYDGNTISDIQTYLDTYADGVSTYSYRQYNALSKEEVSYMCHTGSSKEYATSTWNEDHTKQFDGYYTDYTCIPTYAVSSFHSIICDISTTVQNNVVTSRTITWHTEGLDEALETLFPDGLGAAFYKQILSALPNGDTILDKLERIDAGTYEEDEFEPIYLASEIPDDLQSSYIITDPGYEDFEIDTDQYVLEEGCQYVPATYFLSDTVKPGGEEQLISALSAVIGSFDVKTTYFDQETVAQIKQELISNGMAEQTANSIFLQPLTSTGVYASSSQSLRYRALTDDEISLIMSQLGYDWSPDEGGAVHDSSTASMYEIILTALKSVGKIQYENWPRNTSGTASWEDADMVSFVKNYGFYPALTYPLTDTTIPGYNLNVSVWGTYDYLDSSGTTGKFSADCTSYISWLYYVAGRGLLNGSKYSTSDFYYAVQNNTTITGLTYIGSCSYGTSDARLMMHNTWKAGDIIIMIQEGSTSGHAFIYIGPVDENGSQFMMVDCNGLQGDEADSFRDDIRGCTYYGMRDLNSHGYNFYCFRPNINN
jgi:hypothetical protein